jgi:hypothetical protein
MRIESLKMMVGTKHLNLLIREMAECTNLLRHGEQSELHGGFDHAAIFEIAYVNYQEIEALA